MEKTYSPDAIEARWYDHWESTNAFAPSGDMSAEPYAVMMPPPNVTGSLHMGHALDNTLQDILVRFERLRGKDVLWQPGTDHAGIATQMVVERQLDAEGIDRRDMGRGAFIDRVWTWKAESGGTITQQLRKLGASCDWTREAFTMDEARSEAVIRKFVALHKKGLITRAQRLVNWDPKLKTAISDLEVEQREVDGHYWHFKYPIDGEDGRYITIATTRPETMLGDTAVAVHPDDARYQDLIGKNVCLPLVGRLIPIVGDDYADPEQGSGAVKITPAHDFNDFEVGRRHGLEMINIMDDSGAINANAPDSYTGLDRFEARKKIISEMEALGFLEKIEPTRHAVPYGDRGGVVIEPWLTDQWYVDAETLAKPAIAAVEDGRVSFVPKTWEKTYFEWMRNIQPWCVSRQLWWGHQIPAWYAPDGTVFVEETEDEALAAARAHFGDDVTLTRDPDVLDTWFSSAMWPYSTQGWPQETEALSRYYPGATLVTGFDIIFFWVARMMMSGMEFMDDIPFKTIYIHALVRDEHGAKMSKSKGNVINPLDFIRTYGADALRFTLAAMEAQGRDIKLSEKRVEGYRNFGTKLWNATRFCLMNGVAGSASGARPAATSAISTWIMGEVDAAAARVTKALDAFRFNEAADAIYHFTWGTFCDWYIELVKPVLFDGDAEAKAEAQAVTGWVLDQILVLLHPFMPFITEELWHALLETRSHDLIHARWPETAAPGAGDTGTVDTGDSQAMNAVIALISEIRSARTESNIPAGAKVELLVLDADAAEGASSFTAEIGRLARVETIRHAEAGDVPKAAIRLVVGGVDYAIPLEGVLDIGAERDRLSKQLEKLTRDYGALSGRLANEKFVANAPEAVVTQARDQQADLKLQIDKAKAALDRLA